MSKSIPKISKYMSTLPFFVEAETNVFEAMQMMEKEKIRHLPVMRNKKVMGLLSRTDIKNIFSLTDADPKTIKVEDVCTYHPYTTQPNAFINEVASEMASKKMGSAVVLDNGKLVGIFTATDACQALSDICKQRFHT